MVVIVRATHLLKLTFDGQTITRKRQEAIANNDAMIRPALKNWDMGNITMELVEGNDQMVADMAFHINVPSPAVKIILQALRRDFRPDDNVTAWRWIGVVMRMEMIYAQQDTMDIFYHRLPSPPSHSLWLCNL